MTMSESTHPTAPKQEDSATSEKEQGLLVLKIGGSILEKLHKEFFEEITALQHQGWFPIIVHGGGPAITSYLTKLGKKSSFINGLRVTDAETVEVVQMVLSGKENKEIVRKLTLAGGKAIGLSGVDHQMIIAEPMNQSLGFVGRIKKIAFPMLDYLKGNDIIPVISPIATDEQGQIYNINADTVAQELAAHIHAKKIFFISDTPGIYLEDNGKKEMIHSISIDEIDEMKTKQQIIGGMVPKVEAAVNCIRQEVDEVYIMDHHFIGTKIIS